MTGRELNVSRSHRSIRQLRRRAVGMAAAVVAAAIALSGCSGIPRSGGVNEGGDIAGPADADIEFLPAGPVSDAAPALTKAASAPSATSTGALLASVTVTEKVRSAVKPSGSLTRTVTGWVPGPCASVGVQRITPVAASTDSPEGPDTKA